MGNSLPRFFFFFQRFHVGNQAAFIAAIQDLARVRESGSKHAVRGSDAHAAFEAGRAAKKPFFFNQPKSKQSQESIPPFSNELKATVQPLPVNHQNSPIIVSCILIMGDSGGNVNPMASRRALRGAHD